MQPPSRPSSPLQISEGLTHSLKQAHDTIEADKEQLGKLDIPKLKDALFKLGKLLELSKKVKGNEDAVVQLVGLAEYLAKTTLTPIAEAMKNPAFCVSRDLTENLCAFFITLEAAVPEKGHFTHLKRLLHLLDVARVVVDANPKIENAIESFLQKGCIRQTEAAELVQVPDDLKSQAGLALVKCPKFRILLLGRSGSGKSSLINKVFGINSAEVSDYRPGLAQIEREHHSQTNPYFLLHDSMGFESGTVEQYAIVEKFIKDRGKQADPRKRINAIWLCISIPIAGGRVLETGDENIFRMDLGTVPLIVIFTKYDTLVTNAEHDNPTFNEEQAKQKAEKDFKTLCIQPLTEICNDDLKRKTPSYTKVSIERGYEPTLVELIALTRRLLPADTREKLPENMGYDPDSIDGDGLGNEDPVMPSAEITLAIAQRTDPSSKVDAAIA